MILRPRTPLPVWKNNLFVCWFGMFVTSVGMSQLAPVLPLYLRHLGVTDAGSVELFSGLAFGITFVISAIFSPVWGLVADKYGRKPMLLRASLGMAVVIFCMGFAQNVWELVALRLLQGVITGYSTACTTLIATQTDKENAGWALGTLSTAGIAGSLLGPVFGGFLAEGLGYESIFYVTGGLMTVSFVTTLLYVKEDFVPREKKVPTLRETWAQVPEKGLTLALLLTFFTATLAAYSIQPILTVFVSDLPKGGGHVALVSGLVFSAAGLASLLSAPVLGKVSDKAGPQKVTLVVLVAAGVILIPQAFVTDPWQLMALRFALGLTTAGLGPSVNTLVKRITPPAITGRIFGLTMSAGYLGIFGGSLLGGWVAAGFGIRSVFLVTGALLLATAAWVRAKIVGPMARVRADTEGVGHTGGAIGILVTLMNPSGTLPIAPTPVTPLVLHSCCAPCSAGMLSALVEHGWTPTVFYFNPNIFPREEYEIRKSENQRYAETLGLEFFDGDYDHEGWKAQVWPWKDEPERGRRCEVCFDIRLTAAARFCSDRGFRLFATTLGSSRWKNLDQISAAGRRAVDQYPGISFWDANWRKGGLAERQAQIVKDQAFYRQNYCGCEFSRPKETPAPKTGGG